MSGLPSLSRPRISWRPLRAVPLVLVLLLATADVAAAAKPPPDTVIDSGPAALTKSTSGPFTFHSTDKTATFTCRLDGSAWVACASPTTFSGLAAGTHNFSVDASAGGIADPTPATASWTIDLTAPTAPTNLVGSSPTPTSVSLTWTASTDANGVTNNVVLRDGASLAVIGAVAAYTDSTVAAGSTHTYAVEAQDGAGNLSAPSNTVSVTTAPPLPAPDTIIDGGPATLTNSTSATFAFHSTIPGSTFTCKLDAGKAGSCTSPKAYTALAAGSHTFSVFATANGLNDLTPAPAPWTIDLTPPSIPTGVTASASATSVTLSWSASTDNIGVTGYRIYRGGSMLTALGAATTYADTTVMLGVTYTYTIDALDAAGNASPQSSGVAARPQAAYDSHLTRAPYLTDLVGLHVAINWATDQSATTGSVAYGVVGAGGSCSPTTIISASRITISVGTVFEYQWKGDLTLPATGTYCYRVLLGGTDLLGGNASPAFTTQVPFGSTESYSFAVFGDWGQVDTTGQNAGQAALMQQIAGSGARFAISTGDNGYPNGSQINYGDLQQSGADTSAIFGSAFWTVPGSTIPLFSGVGNHGVSGVKHTDITTWTQSMAVSSSGGRYQNDVYCCINGTFSSNYGSEWYAFSAGNVRFYVLDSAWGDTNGGTATPYANDALAHFAPGTPQYIWLLNDLTTHPTQLKFAFSHYPFYSDNPTQPSDTYLDGAANLEGMLGQHGVQLAFNGHAHIYERNRASAAGMPVTYVTGGGGATLEPMGTCSTFDAYAIGWSPSHGSGSTCGTAVAPTSAGQVYHFLKVTVSGTTVTVTPTDSTGRTFDVQTYTFRVPTDTYIDSSPPLGTPSTSATFTFHASGAPATFKCQLDALSQTACTSPITYNALAQAKHTFKVTATVNKSGDPTPALATWTVDFTKPNTPANLAATATSPFNVNLTWSGATDNLGVTGYDVFRDGVLYQSLANVTGYTDAVLGSSTHQYQVSARDIAGNFSAPGNVASVTTAPPPPPVFTDGFESGDLSAWNASGGLVVEGSTVNSGAHAAEGNTTNGATYAKATLPSTYADAYARVWFNIVGQTSQVNLLRLRDSTGASIGWVYVDTTGLLGFHNDATGINTLSGVSPSPGWHALELHIKIDPAAGVVEVWIDNSLVADLSGSNLNTGSSPAGAMQIGETQSGRTYDVVFDDAAFGTSRLGPEADTLPPSVPGQLTATAIGPFEADLAWTASTDNIAVDGYDVFRDGTLIASLGTVLSYADMATVAGVNHTYAVRARDASGNVSALSAPATVTQPPAQQPLFADGFETGDLSSWTTTSGLTVEATDTHSGTSAADGNTVTGATFAKKTLAATYPDAYARVAFRMNSQSSQVTLLRLRDTPAGNGGYIYLTAGGKLGFRSDAQLTGTTSSVVPVTGWHVLELHLLVNGASSKVEVWLDGTPVTELTSSAVDLGTVAGIGVLQIGETATGTWDVIVDDAAFGTSRLGPTSDASPPTMPSNLSATATSPFSVGLAWDASTDDVGVTGYDLFRDGALLVQLSSPGYADNTVLAGSTHQYAVRSRDSSGNVSALTGPVAASTPAAGPPVFADGFETGDVSAWTTTSSLTLESTDVHSGGFAAEGSTTAGSTFATKSLAGSYQEAYARVAFEVKSQGSQVTLLRLRDTPTGTGGYVYVTSTGKLGYRSDAQLAGTTSAVAPGPGWHVLELHLSVNGATSLVEVWLDGVGIPDLTFATDLGTVTGIAFLQIGDTATGKTWDVALDDAAFGSSRLGPGGDTNPPSVPANLAATATSAFSVQLSWDASSDDVGVAVYDVFRDGVLLGQVSSPAYTDATVLASTSHQYAVRARDVSGNISALSAPASATTPAAALPLFADGFETGDLSAWTTASKLAIESNDTNSGTFAVEGTTATGVTYAKKTLGSTYPDAYARVAFQVYSQGSQLTLLRLRDTTPAGNGGYLYVTSSGKLGFRSDALAAGTTSSVVPGPGWHVLELHLFVNSTSSVVEVWLDGVAVPDLTFSTIDLGTAPIGIVQVGDTATTGSWDVVLDDAAFGTSRLGPAGDSTAPSVPANLVATATSPFSVQVSWDASTDDVGVTGYDVIRDGAVLGQVTSHGYQDNAVFASQIHVYTVRARDASGNVSALSAEASVMTPDAPTPVFADGFETGSLSAWNTGVTGLVVESSDVHSGGFAAEGNTTTGSIYVKKTLPTTYADAYARVAFEAKSQTSQVTLLRLRDTPTGNGGYLFLTGGKLAFRSDALGTATVSAVSPASGWHVLELHLNITSGVVEVWLDGAAVTGLTQTGVNLGAAPMGVLQVGDSATSGTWDVVLDDAAFGTSRLGPGGDSVAPSVPANVAANATSPFSVQLTWDASTDNVAVSGYDVLRDSAVLAQVSSPGYTDNAVLPGEIHQYAVRARDASGNISPLSASVAVLTPDAPTPLFADGFETGNGSAWTTVTGLAVEYSDVHSGGFAAEGNTATGSTFAKKTLAGPYTNAYARVAFEVKSQGSQVTLLRLRDTPTGNGAYLFLTSGKLAFRSDAMPAATISGVSPASGWHALELHLFVNGSSSAVEVWLDGASVPALTFSVTDLGTVAGISVLQVGETATTGIWDVVLDDAAFGTSRLGPGGAAGDNTPPSMPANLLANPTSAFSVQLSWDASTDNVGATGYDVFRDGLFLAQPSSPGYTDSSVLANSSHQYAVRARDASGNVSAIGASVSVTTPPAAAPLFADGFESGSGSAWTTFTGLAVESTDAHSGTDAAEGNPAAGTAFAKKTLPSTYADVYARVAFKVNSQASGVTLIRLRDTPTGLANGGLVGLTAGGKLQYRDAAGASTTSTVSPGAGWHEIELHLAVSTGVVEVWLDGVAVPDLTRSAVNNGTAAIGSMQIGDTASGTWDVLFDDVAFGTSRLGVG